jgi:phage terminase small subunit
MAGTQTAPKAQNRPSAAPERPLTPRQQRFVDEYLIDLNAQQACIRAGYSAKTADKQGSQVLGHPRVQARIAAAQARRAAAVQVDSDFVLRRLLDEVNADARDLYGPDGDLLPVPQWPAVWRRGLVSTIRTTRLYGRGADRETEIGVQTDVVLVDRARRLELLGKHIKVNAFAERITVGMDTPLQELFRQISGNVIRPAIEHDPGRQDPAQLLPPEQEEDP